MSTETDVATFPSHEREWLQLLGDAFIGNAIACISAYRALGGAVESDHAVRVSGWHDRSFLLAKLN